MANRVAKGSAGARLRRGEQREARNSDARPIPRPPVFRTHSNWHSYAILFLATLACLVPFSGKAFNIDDTLFVLSAKQIVQHPFDPYGFRVVWERESEPMSNVTKNPPLACYYGALVGRVAGW